jgi:hypothetical protein
VITKEKGRRKKKGKKLGVVVYTCNPSYLGGEGRRSMTLRPA